MITDGTLLLTVAGSVSLALAIAHVGMIFVGARAYRYFGAGERMVQLAEQRSWIPPTVTAAVALVLAIFGAYALSGSGQVPPLPLLRLGLIAIGSIYCVRGLLLIYELGRTVATPGAVALRSMVFSLTSLTIGVGYLWGTWIRWPMLSPSL
jgi:hypothetical protein